MEALLQWGLDLIVAIQGVSGPVLDSIFRALTFTGEEQFYLVLLPLLLWCVDYGLGVRVAALLMFSSYLNVGLKDLFQQPRPYHLNPSVGLSSSPGYGLPSDHAQSSVVVWGSIAAWTRKTWSWVVAIALMVLVGFSRVYLGVHFPTDVLAGWTLGAALLALYLALQPGIVKRLVELSLGAQLLVALAVPILLLLIHPVKDATTRMGALAGMGLGLVLMYRYVSFRASGPWWQRVVRFLIGGAIVFALYLGLSAVFPGEQSALYLVFRFLRYGLVGLWTTLGAPWLFRLLRLTAEAEGQPLPSPPP